MAQGALPGFRDFYPAEFAQRAYIARVWREVALRPEMTPSLARMVAARANALRKPVRWFSLPQLFRYERQQKGRLREHFQLNVDIIGEAGVTGGPPPPPLADDRLPPLRPP